MSALSPILSGLLERHEPAALVVISAAIGSTPREAGATLLVSASGSFGTIGGGQLEYHAIDRARAMLAAGEDRMQLDLPLGPQMGQCCGGRVVLALRRATLADVALLEDAEAAETATRPSVLVFGAGHTGRALIRQLALLPFATTLIDDRAEELAQAQGLVPLRLMADPEAAIAEAPAGAGYLIMTHSHALDYRLTDAALRRGDAAYVGLIGSATKRARFLSQYRQRGGPEAQLVRFACPIGGNAVADKRPAVIAALAAAELVTLLLGQAQKTGRQHDAA